MTQIKKIIKKVKNRDYRHFEWVLYIYLVNYLSISECNKAAFKPFQKNKIITNNTIYVYV